MIGKKEYIMNQLRRTRNKKYENYCITRIIHKLDRQDVQFVTQQLFKRYKGKIALADLYFPQINTYVEIDEPYHDKQYEADMHRKEEIAKYDAEIKRKIANFEEIIINPIEELRIHIEDKYTIEDINREVDKVVDEIKLKIKEKGDKFIPWNYVYLEPQFYINKGFIKVTDNIKFRTIQKVSELFNKGYKGMQHAYFDVDKDNKIYVWCPKLKLGIDYCENIPYVNEVSEDGKYIYESAKKDNEKFLNFVINSKEKRYVFAYYKDETGCTGYKFLGIYILDSKKSKLVQKRAWKKQKEEIIDLKKYFKK